MARVPIGIELVRRGIVSESDINKAIEYQRSQPNKKIGDILHILGLCNDEVLIKKLQIFWERRQFFENQKILLLMQPTIYLQMSLDKIKQSLLTYLEGK